MFDDEVQVRPKEKPEPPVLDTWSIGELKDYIGWLEEEIRRVQQEIHRKETAGNAAAAFFKS